MSPANARDRWVAGAAIAVLLVLAAVIVGLVLDAQHAGIDTRADLRVEQVHQLAGSLDTRVQQAYSALATVGGGPGTWHMTPNDPDDAARLKPTNPAATSGSILVNRKGIVVNGSLLRDPSVIGTRFRREGLALALGGEPTLLGVGPGLTTSEPVIGVATPVHAADGELAGAYIIESEVSATAAFGEEVAQLRAGETGVFSYIDASKHVVASSDEAVLAQRTDLPDDALRPGFHRFHGFVTATAEVPAARWSLVFQQRTSEFEGDLTGPLRSALLILLLTGVIGGGMSVVALSRRLRSSREEQRRLADISQAREEFTSMVSHELRTPVAGLLGFLQTTVDHWTEMSDDDRLRAVTRAHQNADRLQHLTTEVLDTTSLEAGQARYHLEPVDLRDVLSDAVTTVHDAHSGRSISLTAPDDPVPVEVDTARVGQVLNNLLDNAMKSSPLNAPIEVSLSTASGSATVRVRDYGTGIPVEDRERVFDKFTRGRVGLSRGSGLGLFLAREIVHAHGGRIWVDDVEGVGTALVFTLPMAGARAGR